MAKILLLLHMVAIMLSGLFLMFAYRKRNMDWRFVELNQRIMLR